MLPTLDLQGPGAGAADSVQRKHKTEGACFSSSIINTSADLPQARTRTHNSAPHSPVRSARCGSQPRHTQSQCRSRGHRGRRGGSLYQSERPPRARSRIALAAARLSDSCCASGERLCCCWYCGCWYCGSGAARGAARWCWGSGAEPSEKLNDECPPGAACTRVEGCSEMPVWAGFRLRAQGASREKHVAPRQPAMLYGRRGRKHR